VTAEPPPTLEERLAAVEALLDELLARLDAGEPLPPPASGRDPAAD